MVVLFSVSDLPCNRQLFGRGGGLNLSFKSSKKNQKKFFIFFLFKSHFRSIRSKISEIFFFKKFNANLIFWLEKLSYIFKPQVSPPLTFLDNLKAWTSNYVMSSIQKSLLKVIISNSFVAKAIPKKNISILDTLYLVFVNIF